MMYYVFRPQRDDQLLPRQYYSKFSPIPLPWPTKNENIMADNADKARVEGVYE